MTRNKSQEAPRPHRFGWCVTGHHSRCRGFYVNILEATVECQCPCHAEA